MRVRVLIVASATSLLALGAYAADSSGVRDVSVSERGVIPLSTKVRYTTMILLPDGEEILDVVCGDKDFWVVSATQNIAYVKPAKEGAATNLNLVTAQGAVYSFLLSENGKAEPDLKVYITGDGADRRKTPKYVSAADYQALESRLAATQAEMTVASQHATETIAAFREQYPTTLQFAYGVPKYQKPFYVRSIWNDGHFTYIKSDARELPTLYEQTDGGAALVNFQVQRGTYVVPKVLDRGYLALGKTRLSFQQER